jgi:hypothetical protein
MESPASTFKGPRAHLSHYIGKDSVAAIMEFVQALFLLDHPAAQLLRLPTAAFVLAFLDEAFHVTASAAVAEDSLRMRLERWLDERRADESFT